MILLGLCMVSCIVLPYLILGEHSYVQIHDQMDGEILNYIYQAKYLFKGNTIQEFMNGASKASMLPPAPLGVLFYKLLSPFWAFVAMQWFVLLVGFLGMYLLLKELRINGFLALGASVLFCYLPFYPVYGLAALGQPMAVWAGLQLYQEKGKKSVALLMLALYAGFSSLTLIGYVWIVFGYAFSIYLAVTRKKAQGIGIAQGTTVLTIVYFLTNLELFRGLFGNDGFVTHRTEMVLESQNLWDKFKSLLLTGGSYSNVYSHAILLAVVFTALIGLILHRKSPYRNLYKSATGTPFFMMLLMSVLFVVLALAAAMWSCTPIIALRKLLGGPFTYFQADRIYWFFPFLCVLILTYTMQTWLEWSTTSKSRFWKTTAWLTVAALFMIQGCQEFRDGTLNKNIRLLFFDNYEQVTWESIYMADVFDEIENYIDTEKESYSVVSLGMYPSIPLYHGFTCADGYSNNYDVAYKHRFLEMLGEELDKEEEVRAYLADWGNRLYLVSAEYGVSPMLGKDRNVIFHDISWDIEAMKSLNIRYIFSAGEIRNAELLGLRLVREEPFESDSSYYRIWLYEIQSDMY